MPEPIQASRPQPQAPAGAAAPSPSAAERRPSANDIGQAALEQALDDVQGRRVAHSRQALGRSRRAPPPASVPLPSQPGEVGIYLRSFHPEESFDGGFEGDRRGFQTDGGSARIHGGVVLNDQLEISESDAFSSPSRHPLLGSRRGRPRMVSRASRVGDTVTLRLDYSGNMPLIPLSPDADAHAVFELTERSPTELHIHAQVEGDAFPAAETFIRDSSGQAVFIGVRAIHEAQDAVSLIGDGHVPLIDAELTVIRDEESGVFEAVEYNGNRYTVAAWNELFESIPAMVPSH